MTGGGADGPVRKPAYFGAHDPSPHVYDAEGCGRYKLFVGGENGYIYVYDIHNAKLCVFTDADGKKHIRN